MNRRGFLLQTSSWAIGWASLAPCAVAQATIARATTANNRKGSWLPHQTDDDDPRQRRRLKTCQMRTLVAQYQGPVLTQSLDLSGGRLEVGEQVWSSKVAITRPSTVADALDVKVTVGLERGNARDCGVAVAFDFSNWTREHYVLAPAAVYDGNRFEIYPAAYPPYIQDPALKTPNMPVVVTNIHHLNRDGSAGKIELLAGATSTPLLAAFDPKARSGFVILTEQKTRFGDVGLIIEEDLSRGRATFVVSAPGVREKRYVMTGFTESDDRGAAWTTGEPLTLSMRVFEFDAVDLQAFFDRILSLRKDLSGPTHYAAIAPFSHIRQTVLEHHDRTKWSETAKYMTQDHRGVWPWDGIIQVGWGGPPVLTYPYAIYPTPERLRRLGLTLDALTKLQAPTGLVYAKRNGQLLGDNHADIHRPNQVLSRRFGEALYFGVQNLDVLKARGHAIAPAWETLLSRLADALVRLWRDNGQFGQFVDVETGKIDVYGSSAGVVCATALALASRYFARPEYLTVARAAADVYYQRNLAKGYSGGGPREALQAPDSESAHSFVDLFVTLFEMSGSPQDLARARHAAAHLATWMVSYDYAFPAASPMGRLGVRSTGAVFANAQNTHAAPVLWIHSGDFLLKLFRMTGDQRYAALARDLVHNAVQYVTTADWPLITGAAAGSVSERVQLNDWEGADAIGDGLPAGDSRLEWEVGVVLTISQNPGLYIRTDTGQMVIFDHVEAKVVRRHRGGVTVALSNRTQHPATVSVMAENAARAAKPMGSYGFLKWPTIDLAAGQTRTVRLGHDGALLPTT